MDRQQSKTISVTLFVLAIAIFLTGIYLRSAIYDTIGPVIYNHYWAEKTAIRANLLMIGSILLSIVLSGAGFYVRALGKK